MNKNWVDVLGVKASAINYQSVLDRIFSWVKTGQKNYVCVAAVHLVMECQQDASLLAGVNRSGLVTPDGMPLVWLLKLADYQQTERVYGPDLMLKVCEQANRSGTTIFLLGGAEGQSQLLKNKLTQKFPDIKIVGHVDTPTRPLGTQENRQIIKKINASSAQIIFVGLGCPHQERWMISNVPRLKNGVAIGVGAAFDFITGRVKQAPKWMRAIGLEWFFRLIQEPRRLAKRYLILNVSFVWKIAGKFTRSLLIK
ncbi:MAG TPA: WecB/TagA/CpsF family glycosyltransferase [Patescibacteria group bacterium]|jgi:N-acetylglucosaminyldiphosphoundecaprenol N-acetyl-beta-D-mannosaminyltransferase